MADTYTDNFQLTKPEPGRSGWDLKLNGALDDIDLILSDNRALSQLVVVDKDLTEPPVSPADRDAYIIATGATGAWAGHDGKIAIWGATAAAWSFIVPAVDWVAYLSDEDCQYRFDGASWKRIDEITAVTIDFTADADLVLNDAQNANAVYALTDTSVVLTTARNVIVGTTQRLITVANNTKQQLTVKTVIGTGIAVPAGEVMTLRCDGVNVLFDAASINVPANSKGNVPHWVMSTAKGGTGVEDGANTWAKLADIIAPEENYSDFSSTLLLEVVESTNKGLMVINVNIRQQLANMDTSYSGVEIVSSNTTAVSYNSLKLTSTGSTVELWIKKNLAYLIFSVTELTRVTDKTLWDVSYNHNAAWQSTMPTGADNITSDWAGSGLKSSTSLSNSTGTVHYEKDTGGNVTAHFTFNTITNTADGTVLFTMPDGFCHGITGFYLPAELTAPGVSGGAAGRLLFDPLGDVLLYNFVAGSSATWRASITYRARA